jgi:hypothetical protein
MRSSSRAQERRSCRSRRLAAWLAAAALAAWGQGRPAPKALGIADAAVSQSEDGAPAGSQHEFYPGETVFLSWRVDGYKRVERDDRDWLKLEWRVEAEDPAGVPLVAPAAGKVDTDLAPQDKEWRPKLRHEILLPPLIPSGRYKVRIVVTDAYAGAKTEREIPLNVRGYDVEPSDTLTVRNLGYFRGEEDRRPLSVAAYRPGDVVWAKFDITGFRRVQGNRFEVTYGLEVLRENGERLFEQTEAARIAEANFYPKRAVPGAFSLTLTPDLAKGPYTVVLRVRDELGNQSYETKTGFTVE